ncbi:fimbrillin family protein [Alistipes timonensis]|uniref:fimbrillin family protein n=1 Tax=Alistipes timonensis TaxID=1465754 RepID=UPI001898B953|nr:fimbrillin family protein [Alistipes timonensis]
MACWALVSCAAWAATSCTQDALDGQLPDPNAPMTFGVAVSDTWVDGTPVRPARAETIVVDELACPDGMQPLYLVTEVSEPVVSEEPQGGSDAATRGVQIGSEGEFHDSFGLSGICYTGSFPADGATDGLTTNFAHDIEMVRTASGTWDGKKLYRPGSGRLRFFAYAPHSSDERLKGALRQVQQADGGLPRITYTVPLKTEDQLDIMAATVDCAGSGSAPVELKFGHVLTSVTVKTGDAMLGGTVTKVEFSGVWRTGTHVIGSGSWSHSGDKGTFTVENEVELPDQSDENADNAYTKPGTPLVDGKLTLLMLPQTLPDDAALKVFFTDDLTGKERTLTASLGGKEWPVGRRVSYSISSTGIVIEPTVEIETSEPEVHINGYLSGVQLAAYARVVQKDHPEATVALPYVVQYSTDDGKTWTQGGWVPDKAPSEGADPAAKVAGRLKLDPQSSFTAQRAYFSEQQLAEQLGSESAPHDLSGGGETANCYLVHSPGYYSLPTVYGNARTAGAASYTYIVKEGGIPEDVKAFILTQFVDHNDQPISGPGIPDVADAVLVWQDAPGLVTDVKYEGGMVRFRVAEERLTQGNAVIAVRDASKTILWSWHIWATHYMWDGSADLTATTAKADVDGPTSVAFAPCNLGFCEPRKGNDARTFRVRFVFTLPDGKNTTKTIECKSSFTQPEIVASIAGDNTYYQWGRKEPMLPGIYNKETRDAAVGRSDTQFNMIDKPYYVDHEEYKFRQQDNMDNGKPIGATIGEAIKGPYVFFKHNMQSDNADEKYFRRHWHSGEGRTPNGLKTIMNYWNSQLDQVSEVKTAKAPNGFTVTKTIYDPCPAGYHIPAPNAFVAFGAVVGDSDIKTAYGFEDVHDPETNYRIGWKLSLNETNGGPKIFFPATGLRDMGLNIPASQNPTFPLDRDKDTTWPAFADVTFVATTGFAHSTGTDSYQSLLFYLDNRQNGTIHISVSTNNAYGFTVRPVHD